MLPERWLLPSGLMPPPRLPLTPVSSLSTGTHPVHLPLPSLSWGPARHECFFFFLVKECISNEQMCRRRGWVRSEAWNYLGQTLSTRAPPAERSDEGKSCAHGPAGRPETQRGAGWGSSHDQHPMGHRGPRGNDRGVERHLASRSRSHLLTVPWSQGRPPRPAGQAVPCPRTPDGGREQWLP